jgi:serine/threonine-protein kinase
MDGRSDIYAAGCLMYEVLTGNPPYGGAASFDVMNKHLQEAVPAVPESKRAPQLQAILNRAMAKKPEDRYQEAGEMSRDLSLINEVPYEDWAAQAYCMRPPEPKPQKVIAAPAKQFNPADLIKPALIAIGTLAVFIGSLVAFALADPNVPSLAKYKVAVQEVILPAKDPRLLKNLEMLAEHHKKAGQYAEAWEYKKKYLQATQPPTSEESAAEGKAP